MLSPPQPCPVEDALRLLSGKWRLFALFHLGRGPQRFNALQRQMAPVTQKVLTATLRALEEDGLIWRKSEASVPPHVTYGLTERGAGLAPVFEALARWRLGEGFVPPEGGWPARS
jgi:DNA-binding HxlR family transcriptional regulator